MTAETPAQAAYEALHASIARRQPAHIWLTWDAVNEVNEGLPGEPLREDLEAAAQAAIAARPQPAPGLVVATFGYDSCLTPDAVYATYIGTERLSVTVEFGRELPIGEDEAGDLDASVHRALEQVLARYWRGPKQCVTCDGSGTLTVPDRSGESADGQPCPDPVHDAQPQPAPEAVSVNDLPVTPGAAALYRLASRWWNEAFRLGRLLDQKHPRAVALEDCSTTLRAAVNDLRRDGGL